MADIAIRNLTKHYPNGFEAVRGVDLDVTDGELLVLVGPSGCGKSTLLRMIAGLEEATAGTITIDGRDVTRLPPKDRDIAMVFQSYALYPHMTVRRNIGYPLRLARIPKPELDRRVPVVVENDVNAAALGAGAVLASDDLAYLSIGTGVAAGLLLDGRLRRGRVGVAGEIGHLSVDPAGPRCACGQRGCLEMVASGPAIARRWPTADGTSPAAALFAAAATDARARAARDALGGYLAHAVVLLALVVDPGLVVLGGGVSEVGVPLLDAVVDALERMTAVSPFLGALELGSRTVLAPTDPPVAAVGAALAAATHPNSTH